MIWLSLAVIVASLAVGTIMRYRHKLKETQIHALRGNLQEEIKKTCEKAKKGDTSAVAKLEALKETLTEQSVRLTGQKKPPSTVILPPDAARS